MKKVLIVDDSASMRNVVHFTISSEGHTGILAENGLEALGILRNTDDIDLIITDVNMPMMNGLELVSTIRSDVPQHKYTPIIIVTTESSQQMKDKGRKAGATGWIVKPYDPNKLNAVINRLL